MKTIAVCGNGFPLCVSSVAMAGLVVLLRRLGGLGQGARLRWFKVAGVVSDLVLPPVRFWCVLRVCQRQLLQGGVGERI